MTSPRLRAARPSSSRSRGAAFGAAALLATGLLGGCSVAGTDFQPGVAARVGGDTVTSSEVDRLTVAACDAFGPQLAAANQVLPLRLIKTTVAQNLALGSAVRQLGQEYDVAPGPAYEQSLATAVPADADLSTREREAVELVSGTNALVSDVLGQVGAEVAAEAGGSGAQVAAASQEAVTLGGEELTAWLERNDVELDPQYGVAVTDTGSQTTDTALSFPVSDLARAGAAESEPDPATTMALPQTQRCGSYAASGGAG